MLRCALLLMLLGCLSACVPSYEYLPKVPGEQEATVTTILRPGIKVSIVSVGGELVDDSQFALPNGTYVVPVSPGSVTLSVRVEGVNKAWYDFGASDVTFRANANEWYYVGAQASPDGGYVLWVIDRNSRLITSLNRSKNKGFIESQRERLLKSD